MNDLDQIVSDAVAQFAGTGDAAELERVKAQVEARLRLAEIERLLGVDL